MKVFVLAFLLVGLAFANSDMDKDEYEIYKSAGFKARKCVVEKIMAEVKKYKLEADKEVANILFNTYFPECWESVGDMIDITQPLTDKQLKALSDGEILYNKVLKNSLDKRIKELNK